MSVRIADAILGSCSSHRPSADPELACAVNHISVIRVL